MNTSSVIDTPEAIARYALCVLRARLRLEVAGMRSSGPSALSILKRKHGYKGNGRTVLATLNADLAASAPTPTVAPVGEYGSNDSRDAAFCHYILTGGETGE